MRGGRPQRGGWVAGVLVFGLSRDLWSRLAAAARLGIIYGHADRPRLRLNKKFHKASWSHRQSEPRGASHIRTTDHGHLTRSRPTQARPTKVAAADLHPGRHPIPDIFGPPVASRQEPRRGPQVPPAQERIHRRRRGLQTRVSDLSLAAVLYEDMLWS